MYIYDVSLKRFARMAIYGDIYFKTPEQLAKIGVPFVYHQMKQRLALLENKLSETHLMNIKNFNDMGCLHVDPLIFLVTLRHNEHLVVYLKNIMTPHQNTMLLLLKILLTKLIKTITVFL